jgi:hypothetical protein
MACFVLDYLPWRTFLKAFPGVQCKEFGPDWKESYRSLRRPTIWNQQNMYLNLHLRRQERVRGSMTRRETRTLSLGIILMTPCSLGPTIRFWCPISHFSWPDSIWTHEFWSTNFYSERLMTWNGSAWVFPIRRATLLKLKSWVSSLNSWVNSLRHPWVPTVALRLLCIVPIFFG